MNLAAQKWLFFEPIRGYNWLMVIYNWQQSDWPHFRYNLSEVYAVLITIAEKSGLVAGKFAHLSKEVQTEAQINILIEEAMKTSEIEGEFLNREDVRFSIKNHLGLNKAYLPVYDMRAQGVVDMMFDMRNSFLSPLTEKKLFEWHAMLLGWATHLHIGAWRTHKEAMQIVSGRLGKQLVHFEAPPSQNVSKEMRKFISWFNDTAPGKKKSILFAPVRAAIAHLYFESIHPFEDGNGRIGRAIAEKALWQGFGYPVMLSLSQAIEFDKKAYYSALHMASKSNEITEWIKYFINVILTAQNEVESQINFILKKATFFDKFQKMLNERQLKVIKRMFQNGVKGFEGGMSAKKYMSITGASKATATRDLQQLLEVKAIVQQGGGRSVRYDLNLL